MSMFSGFTNQISGWVATKTGGHPPAEGEDSNAIPQEQMIPENGAELTGEEGAEAGAAATGGVSGFAKGLMQKGMSIKDNMKEKAAVLNPHALQGMGSSLIGGITNLIPGRKEEEVPNPPEHYPAEMTGEMVLEDDQQQYVQE